MPGRNRSLKLGGIVIHHSRQSGERAATRILRNGPLWLDPPGLEFNVEEWLLLH